MWSFTGGTLTASIGGEILVHQCCLMDDNPPWLLQLQRDTADLAAQQQEYERTQTERYEQVIGILAELQKSVKQLLSSSTSSSTECRVKCPMQCGADFKKVNFIIDSFHSEC